MRNDIALGQYCIITHVLIVLGWLMCCSTTTVPDIELWSCKPFYMNFFHFDHPMKDPLYRQSDFYNLQTKQYIQPVMYNTCNWDALPLQCCNYGHYYHYTKQHMEQHSIININCFRNKTEDTTGGLTLFTNSYHKTRKGWSHIISHVMISGNITMTMLTILNNKSYTYVAGIPGSLQTFSTQHAGFQANKKP